MKQFFMGFLCAAALFADVAFCWWMVAVYGANTVVPLYVALPQICTIVSLGFVAGFAIIASISGSSK